MSQIEHVAVSAPLVTDRQFKALEMQAERWARSGLVPKRLQGKPVDVLLVGMYGHELGLAFTKALREVNVIENTPVPSAQLRVGLAERGGHELWTEESSSERAVVCGRRRGERHVQRVTWTLDDARRAALLDVWVQAKFKAPGEQFETWHKYVVGDDQGIDDALVAAAPDWAKRQIDQRAYKWRENWRRYPADMLWSRAASSLCRKAFGDTQLGLATSLPDEVDDDELENVDIEPDVPDERHGEADHLSSDDDDTVDAEIVEESPTARQDRSAVPPTKPNVYARAIHLAANEAGLSDEALDEILNDECGTPSANAVTRENRQAVLDRIRAATHKDAR